MVYVEPSQSFPVVGKEFLCGRVICCSLELVPFFWSLAIAIRRRP
jgi:hypothetical protein